ncbi:MAG: hypothetical protein KDH94_00515, partial [Coxiellaceae bacterium]|nr:hypothetical protein [Coxiellaceae bacterium]
MSFSKGEYTDAQLASLLPSINILDYRAYADILALVKGEQGKRIKSSFIWQQHAYRLLRELNLFIQSSSLKFDECIIAGLPYDMPYYTLVRILLDCQLSDRCRTDHEWRKTVLSELRELQPEENANPITLHLLATVGFYDESMTNDDVIRMSEAAYNAGCINSAITFYAATWQKTPGEMNDVVEKKINNMCNTLLDEIFRASNIEKNTSLKVYFQEIIQAKSRILDIFVLMPATLIAIYDKMQQLGLNIHDQNIAELGCQLVEAPFGMSALDRMKNNRLLLSSLTQTRARNYLQFLVRMNPYYVDVALQESILQQIKIMAQHKQSELARLYSLLVLVMDSPYAKYYCSDVGLINLLRLLPDRFSVCCEYTRWEMTFDQEEKGLAAFSKLLALPANRVSALVSGYNNFRQQHSNANLWVYLLLYNNGYFHFANQNATTRVDINLLALLTAEEIEESAQDNFMLTASFIHYMMVNQGNMKFTTVSELMSYYPYRHWLLHGGATIANVRQLFCSPIRVALDRGAPIRSMPATGDNMTGHLSLLSKDMILKIALLLIPSSSAHHKQAFVDYCALSCVNNDMKKNLLSQDAWSQHLLPTVVRDIGIVFLNGCQIGQGVNAYVDFCKLLWDTNLKAHWLVKKSIFYKFDGLTEAVTQCLNQLRLACALNTIVSAENPVINYLHGLMHFLLYIHAGKKDVNLSDAMRHSYQAHNSGLLSGSLLYIRCVLTKRTLSDDEAFCLASCKAAVSEHCSVFSLSPLMQETIL